MSEMFLVLEFDVETDLCPRFSRTSSYIYIAFLISSSISYKLVGTAR